MTMRDSIPDFAPLDSVPGGPEHVARADVIAEARTWLDTPYVHQGRTKGVAVDCAGLVIGVARELGVVAPDFDVNGYPREADGTTLMTVCDRFMTRVAKSDLLPGHVMVFAFDKAPAHVGIVGDYLHGGLSIIQALGTSDGKGRVIEWRLEKHRKGWRPVQAFALPGVK
jgi:cell wall-associated NlpC family hydrolase